MYKKILKTLQKTKESFTESLFKSENQHSIHGRKPHFMFSAEQPRFENKLGLTHEQALDLLKRKGYKAESMSGKYGGISERSILVHSPSSHAIKHLMNMAKQMGQDSAIYSNGHNHEMHYLNGENAGMHNKGTGTDFHQEEPTNFYSTLNDGTHFTHNFGDDLHSQDTSMIKQRPSQLAKSEQNHRFNLVKNEENGHPLSNPSPDMKLIHYSPKKGLQSIDPNHHGDNKIGAEYKRGLPDNKTSFYYLSGSEPESIVTQGAKSKYVTSLGDKRVYDIANDPEKLHAKAKAFADTRERNPGVVSRDDFMNEVRNAGYHGFYNPHAGPMKNVVAMFHPMDVEQEHDIHPLDHKLATHRSNHPDTEGLVEAQKEANAAGHGDGKFHYHMKKEFNK